MGLFLTFLPNSLGKFIYNHKKAYKRLLNILVGEAIRSDGIYQFVNRKSGVPILIYFLRIRRVACKVPT